MDLEGLALRGVIVFVKPVEDPKVRESFQTAQGRGIFRVNLQKGTFALLGHHAYGVQTDEFDGLSPEVLGWLGWILSEDRRKYKTHIPITIRHNRMDAPFMQQRFGDESRNI
jgi:hypothetical protein